MKVSSNPMIPLGLVTAVLVMQVLSWLLHFRVMPFTQGVLFGLAVGWMVCMKGEVKP